MSRPTTVPALALVCASAALIGGLLSGCTQKAPELPKAPAGGASSTTATVDYPIAIQRFGGVAGFGDTVNLQDDRTVLAKVDNGQVTCTLDPAAFSAISAAALAIGDSGANGTPTMAHADDLLVLLNGVPTDDARLKDVAPVVTTLFEDLARPKAQRTTCR
ncbi:hypothetical protein [Pedococcus soli]